MKKNNISFSFIIPTFNTPLDYFEKCILSLVNQLDTEDEIIVVDDGSRIELSKEYQILLAELPQTSFLSQNNSGVSVARNKGIANAKGEYLIFVDSDDWISEKAIVKVRNICRTEYPDILYFNSAIEFTNQSLLTYPKIKFEMDSSELIRNIFDKKPPYGDIIGIDAPWGKAFRRDMIIQEHILFPVGIKRCEDAIFCLDTLEVAKKIFYLDEIVYHYRMRRSSVCRKYDENIIKNEIRVIDYYSKYSSKKIDTAPFLNAQIRKIVFGDFMTMYYMNRDNPDTVYLRSCKAYNMFIEYPFLKEAFLDNKIIDKKEKVFSVFVKFNAIKLFYILYFMVNTIHNLLKKYRKNQPICFD